MFYDDFLVQSGLNMKYNHDLKLVQNDLQMSDNSSKIGKGSTISKFMKIQANFHPHFSLFSKQFNDNSYIHADLWRFAKRPQLKMFNIFNFYTIDLLILRKFYGQ